VNGQVCVVVGIADELKPDAHASVQYLRDKLKIDVWMVTGDNARTASAVARQLNIGPDRVVAEALPATKLAIVQRLQSEGRVVAMVGDGVNDSPALAQADVGMSLVSGASEIAAEASDMVLVKGDMASVCTAIHLSRAIFRRIQWNFVWSLLYNILGIPMAAGIFYPFVHTRLQPTVAALAMALSSVSVVLSSLTLQLYRPPDVTTHELDRIQTTESNTNDRRRREQQRFSMTTTMQQQRTGVRTSSNHDDTTTDNDNDNDVRIGTTITNWDTTNNSLFEQQQQGSTKCTTNPHNDDDRVPSTGSSKENQEQQKQPQPNENDDNGQRPKRTKNLIKCYYLF
jgi:magnesium-transporting ATPase (P-type)